MTIHLTPKELVTISEKLGIPEYVNALELYRALDLVFKLSGWNVAWYIVKEYDVLDEIAKKHLYYQENTLGLNIYYDDGNENHFTFVSID